MQASLATVWSNGSKKVCTSSRTSKLGDQYNLKWQMYTRLQMKQENMFHTHSIGLHFQDKEIKLNYI